MDKIEITNEMIDAGAAILRADPELEWGPTACWSVAEDIITEALRIWFQQNHDARDDD